MRLELKPYQEQARDFLAYRERAAGLIGVGLGKTAATLSALKLNIADGCSQKALVVAPLRVARLTWPNEIKKWDQFQFFRPQVLRGEAPSKDANIFFINPERLGELRDLSFCDTVIVDELTRFKSHKSERARHLRGLFKGHRRWGLTGTPRPNSLLEIFAQVRLLDDGKRLGESYDQFQKTWFDPEDWREYKWIPKPGSDTRIYEKIHDLALTLKSSDYLNIPDTVVEDIEVPLSKDAHSIYARLEKDLLARLEGGFEAVAQNSAVLVNKLLQVTGGAVYATEEGNEDHREVRVIHSNKITALKRRLSEYPNENVLVATNYIHERKRVIAAIPGAVDGSEFKGDLEDPRSLGHGLNLQRGGRRIIWYSPNWSREIYDQFNGRLARTGQNQVTCVDRIISPGTIDDAVIEALREKGQGQSDMMNVLSNFRLQGLTFG
jgi:SNF2 family DNA or RNA helicase